MLIKLRKLAGAPVKIINVSQDVFSILEVTGFIELFDVKKKLREVSVEGCEFIGSGGYGKVYRLDSETIVKLYNPGIGLEFVEQERNNSQKAFLMGVPTAISYDVVKCGECFGVVYEMLNAKTVAKIIDSPPYSSNLFMKSYQVQILACRTENLNSSSELMHWLSSSQTKKLPKSRPSSTPFPTERL